MDIHLRKGVHHIWGSLESLFESLKTLGLHKKYKNCKINVTWFLVFLLHRCEEPFVATILKEWFQDLLTSPPQKNKQFITKTGLFNISSFLK